MSQALMRSISVADTGIEVLDPGYPGISDPVWTATTVTPIRGISWDGTVTYVNPNVTTLVLGGVSSVNTGIVLGGVKNVQVTPISLDPCNNIKSNGSVLLGGRTASGTGANLAVKSTIGLVSSVSALQLANPQTNYSLSGLTTTVRYVDKTLTPGYTLNILDTDGLINGGGPALLPDIDNLKDGVDIFVNGVNICEQVYHPFKTAQKHYKLTMISADYVNDVYHFTLNGDTTDPNVSLNYMTQDYLPGLVTYQGKPAQGMNSMYFTLPFKYTTTNSYIIDVLLLSGNESVSYNQKGNSYTTVWTGATNAHLIAHLPISLTPLDAGMNFKIMVKQAVLPAANLFFFVSAGSNNLYSTYFTTHIGSDYVIPLTSMESVNILWDGYDYWVTEINKQPYVSISEKADLNSGSLFDTTYVVTDISQMK